MSSADEFSFLLTRPMRDVTDFRHRPHHIPMVSTHTPHAGRDDFRKYSRSAPGRFLLTRPMRDVTIVNLIR